MENKIGKIGNTEFQRGFLAKDSEWSADKSHDWQQGYLSQKRNGGNNLK